MIAQFFITFKDYLIEVLPFLAIGFFLSGLIHEFIPTGWVERHLGRKRVKPPIYSTLAGTALPICCIGALPVAVSASKRGQTRTDSSLSSDNTSHLDNCSSGLLWPTGYKVHCLHITGDEYRGRNGTVDSGANYHLGDCFGFKERIWQ